jgi:1-acyl-sn-glycerol-3-phosphate acyltransferase
MGLMDDLDRRYDSLLPVIRGICRGLLLTKRIVVHGRENFVRSGRNIIIANHVGSYKDVAVLFRVVPRRIFFLANARLFSRASFQALIRTHLLRHMNSFGTALDLALAPLKCWFVPTIADNIARIGTIPVDLERRRSEALRLCRDYLLEDRAVISLQGMGFVSKDDGHPYVPAFRPGPAVLAHRLRERDGLDVPVTPLAIYGAHWAWPVPSTIHVSIGEPMFISEDLRNGREDPVRRFRNRLETRVKILFRDALRAAETG